LIRSELLQSQFNLGHSSPVRLRRGRVIVQQSTVVASYRIEVWHARAFV
jgi:hypothetical protein